MGQKTHPVGFRLGVIRTWKSRWYAGGNLADLIEQDEKIRNYLKARLGHAAISAVEIERKPGKIVVRRDWKKDSDKIKGAFAIARDLAEKVAAEKKKKASA